MNIAQLNKNRYLSNLIKDIKIIAIITGIFAVWGIIYLVTSYKSHYTSDAMVLIKNMTPDTFVADFDKDSPITPLTVADNPILNEMEIIKSYKMRSILADYIKKNYPDMVKNVSDPENLVDQMVKVDFKSGSDLMTISVTNHDPKRAKNLLEKLLSEYKNLNIGMSKEVRSSKRKYIDKKLSDVSRRLINVRNQIRAFRTQALAIDLDEESKQLVDQKTSHINDLDNTITAIKSTQGNIRAIERQLSMNTKEAMDAVALGSGNDTLNKLRQGLNETTQEYVYDRVKMSDTNPKIVALRNKLSAINAQIKSQIMLTLGKKAKNKGINIYDETRSQLVTNLVNAQTQLLGLIAQRESQLKSLDRINLLQSAVPGKKFVLDNLEQQERILSDAYEQLKQKQIEANLKENEGLSNIVVIDNPNLPKKPDLPGKSQILLLSILLGGLFGVSTSIIKTYFQDACKNLNSIKYITGSNILGVLPWLKHFNGIYDNNPLYDIAYRNIATNLITKRQKNDIGVLTFTSVSTQKCKSTYLYRLACALQNSGQSVLLIDADLKAPTICKDANILDKMHFNLTDLIIMLENKIRNNEIIETQEVFKAIVIDHNGVNILANSYAVEDPYKFFGLSAFNVLISALRQRFNWILIDTPPAMVSPEFLVISKLTSGTVLFTNTMSSSSMLRQTVEVIKEGEIPIVGVIARDKDINLEKGYSEYMKSLKQDKSSATNTYDK